MSQGFGIELPGAHRPGGHRVPARYLVLIDAGGSTVARLFLASYVEVSEFDAGTDEVALMIRGLSPSRGTAGAEWDRALAGHSEREREEAVVYTLDV